MMGDAGLKHATEIAILNSNYLKDSLKDYYSVYDGRVGHEFILDTCEFKHLHLSDVDIAKRLIDYSFHPPTMSWPKLNSLMFEPTESESKSELDRLINSMIKIREEIDEIENNKYSKECNVFKNAPHSIQEISNWNYDYSMDKAFFPLPELKHNKFWPSISRVNDLYGDRLLLKNMSN